METCQFDLQKVRHGLVLSRRDAGGYVENIVVPYRGIAAMSTKVSKSGDGLRWHIRVHVLGLEEESFVLGPFASSDEATGVIRKIAQEAWRADDY